MKLSGVGAKIAEKIEEIITTGTLERLERDSENPQLAFINELSKLPGFTAVRAQ
jgi:DNA polymerase/3'-5' exonuclease PolX